MRRRKRLRAKLQINILNSLLNPFYILEESSLLSSRIFHPPSFTPTTATPPLAQATRSFHINLL
jgi:hypothetical protein